MDYQSEEPNRDTSLEENKSTHKVKRKKIFTSGLYILIAAFGIISFVLISSTVQFSDKSLFGQLYLKSQSRASERVSTADLEFSAQKVKCCNQIIKVNGSKFYPIATVYIKVQTPTSLFAYNHEADDHGNVTFEFNTPDVGDYTIKAYQYYDNKMLLMNRSFIEVTN